MPRKKETNFERFEEWILEPENKGKTLADYQQEKADYIAVMKQQERYFGPRDECIICHKKLLQSAIEDGFHTCPEHRSLEECH